MDMAVCRYNKAHKVKRSRLFIHEMKCPDAKTSKLQTCPYNQQHKVSFENMDKHKRTCPDRPIIDDKLQEEMKNYIQMMMFLFNIIIMVIHVAFISIIQSHSRGFSLFYQVVSRRMRWKSRKCSC